MNDYITTAELDSLIRGKLEDAELLFREGRYDSSYYLSGYAIELALKRRICLTLGWKEGYPKKKFENLQSFKTHKLDILLHFSGIEEKIKKEHFSIWSVVANWDPEMRYSIQLINLQKAEVMIASTKALLEVL